MATWEEDRTRDPNYLSPHCTSGNCTFCRTRRERRRAQSVADLILCAKPSTDLSPWATPIGPRRQQTDIPPQQQTEYPSVTPRQVIYLKDPTSRNTAHKLTGKAWRNTSSPRAGGCGI
jgi:hypothetical protein